MSVVAATVGSLTIRHQGPFTPWWYDLAERGDSLVFWAKDKEGVIWWSDGAMIERLPEPLPEDDELWFEEEKGVLKFIDDARTKEVVPLPSQCDCEWLACTFILEDGRQIVLDLTYVEYLAMKGYKLYAEAGADPYRPVIFTDACDTLCGIVLPIKHPKEN